jgi:hypothetical protein
VSWNQVLEEHPTLFDHFVAAGLGDDPKLWPQVGCGKQFRPWKRGWRASKVVEMQVDGKWLRFLAEVLPERLDDEIKKVQEAFHIAAGQVTAEEMFSIIPVVYPSTVIEGIRTPGVSKFDLVAWQMDGAPVLGLAGWAALCLVITKKDPINLHLISDVAEQLVQLVHEATPKV